MRAIGFCHLLLQSRAPVSRSFSARALPHVCGQLRFPHSLFVRRRTSEHPAVSRRQSDCGGCRWRSPSIIGPLSCLSRLSDVPACGSLRSGPHIEAAPRALCDAVREDHAVLRSGTTSIERYISRPTSCDACRAPPGSGPSVASLCGLRWFCRQRAVLCTPSPRRCRAAFANAVASARPPFTSACLIDADASLGQTQPFDFCNEFSKYDTRARTPRARSSPATGGGPAAVATHDALLTLLVSSSLDAKKIRARCAAASYA